MPFLFCLTLLGSCTEKIDIDLQGSTPILTVDARFTTDKTSHTVVLSKSSDYYNPDLDSLFVSGALVYVEGDNQRFYFKEDPARKGTYRSVDSVFGIMGHSYSLHISEIDIDGDGVQEVYTSQSYMPYITEKLDSIKAVHGTSIPPFFHPDPSILGWSILLYALDPPTDENYAFILSINGKPYNDFITEMTRMPDDFTQGLYINGLALFFFADNSVDPRLPSLKKGDTVSLEARSISPEYNLYISDVSSVISPSTPMFGGSPSNVRGNISNGAFGIFAVYSIRHTSTILN